MTTHPVRSMAFPLSEVRTQLIHLSPGFCHNTMLVYFAPDCRAAGHWAQEVSTGLRRASTFSSSVRYAKGVREMPTSDIYALLASSLVDTGSREPALADLFDHLGDDAPSNLRSRFYAEYPVLLSAMDHLVRQRLQMNRASVLEYLKSFSA